jgi:hypothetical protein
MPDTPQSLADRLLLEGGRVVDFFKKLDPTLWGCPAYPQAGAWTFHELLAHLVSAEVGRGELISVIASGASGAPPEFQIEEYNRVEVEKFSVESNDSLLDRFWTERTNLAGLVGRLTPFDLTRQGNDPYLGSTALIEIIKLTYRHNLIHLREVRGIT